MAGILSQDEIDKLLMAIDPGNRKKSLKERSRGKSMSLSQKEIDNLLKVITGVNYKNGTITGKAEYKRDVELSQEEIDMLLNPTNNDKKSTTQSNS
jgi:flagellar motor switch protein FliM